MRKTTRRLTLNQETVRALGGADLGRIAGGMVPFTLGCPPTVVGCTTRLRCTTR